jgi:hypothetical protein
MDTKYDKEIRERSKLILTVSGNVFINHEKKKRKRI